MRDVAVMVLRAVVLGAVVIPTLAPSIRAAEPFTAFESGHVRPLALSPDGTRLFAVNTPDNRLEIYEVAVGELTHIGSIPVGLEPVAVAARTDTEVWVVNHLSDSISIVDVGAATAPRVVRTLLVGDEPRDIVFGGDDFDRAFVTTAHRGQNSPWHATIESVLTTPGIGRADVWVFDANALGISVAGTPLTVVTLFGDTPRALAVTPDGGTVYAAVFHSGNRTTALSEGVVPDGGESAGGLPEPNRNFQNQFQPEVGLIVQFDGAAWRDELDRDWSGSVRFSLPDYDVFAIDADANPPVAVGGPGGIHAGVGTILFNMVVNPINQKVYVANLESRNRVRFEGPGTHAAGFKPAGEPASVRGHLAESRITVLDGAAVLTRHLNKHIDYTSCCAPLPNAENDTSIAFPLDMAVSSDGATLYVAGFGSSEIGVYDTAALESDTFTPDAADQLQVTGGGPTGVVLDEARSQLYVLTRFDNGVSVLSTLTGDELAHVQMHNPEPAVVVNGRPFLYDAALSSSHGDSACASCHIFGDFDSLTWDLGNPDGVTEQNPGPFVVVDNFPDFRPMKGPMATQSLRGLANHGAMHWRGDRNQSSPGTQPDDGSFNENNAFGDFIVAFSELLGRNTNISGTDMTRFRRFMLEVMYPPNPIRNLDNSLTPAQNAGRTFFFGPVSDQVATCNGCHVLAPNGNAVFGVAKPGFFGTDGRFSFEGETQHFKIPHLRNMYQKVGMFGMAPDPFFNVGDNDPMGDQIRGFGFLHDGSVDTLFRFHDATVFNQTVANPGGITSNPAGDALRRQLEAFMLAFDSNLAPIVGQQATYLPTSDATVLARINLMLNRAGVGECEVAAKARLGGTERGAVYVGGGLFQRDRAIEAPLSLNALLNLGLSEGEGTTFTCAPPGSGTRMGVDRDGDGFYDRDEIDAGSDPADPLSLPPDACSSDPECDLCRRTVVTAAARYAQGTSKALVRCEMAKVKGKLPADTDCWNEDRTARGTNRAAGKLRKAIDQACGGSNNSCDFGGGSDEVQPLLLQWPATCPITNNPFPEFNCSTPITDCSGVFNCLVCIERAAIDQTHQILFDDFAITEPPAPQEVIRCQQAIGKQTQRFLAAQSKALAECWGDRMAESHGGDCPDGDSPPGTPPRIAADAIAKAHARRVDKICRACGGQGGLCDGIDDLSPAAIGFPSTCPDVTVPGAGSCAQPISTLQDVVACAGCVVEHGATCIDRVAVPEFMPFPTECIQ